MDSGQSEKASAAQVALSGSKVDLITVFQHSGVILQMHHAVYTCQLIICIIGYYKICLLLDVGKQTAVGNEGHNDVRGRASIHAHSNYKDRRMFEVLHFLTHICSSFLVKKKTFSKHKIRKRSI